MNFHDVGAEPSPPDAIIITFAGDKDVLQSLRYNYHWGTKNESLRVMQPAAVAFRHYLLALSARRPVSGRGARRAENAAEWDIFLSAVTTSSFLDILSCRAVGPDPDGIPVPRSF